MPVHLIFEGAELSAKSFLMSRIYPRLEEEGSTSTGFLDGCAWITSDIGVFGFDYGEPMVHKYVEIARILNDRSVIFEKLHISDMAYKLLHGNKIPDYSLVEKQLAEMQYRIVFTTFDEDEELMKKRLQDRLNLYPHYHRIAREPGHYIRQQQIYRSLVEKSALPHFEITLRDFSDSEIQPLFDWINK